MTCTGATSTGRTQEFGLIEKVMVVTIHEFREPRNSFLEQLGSEREGGEMQ